MALTSDAFRELIQVQHFTEDRVGQLAGRMDELTAAQQRTEDQVGKLAGELGHMGLRVGMLAERMEKLAEVQVNMQTDVGKLKGFDLERRYLERGRGYFGRIIRSTYVLSGNELRALLDEAIAEGQLSEDYAEDIILADVVAQGRCRDDGSEVYLVVEVSPGEWGMMTWRAPQIGLSCCPGPWSPLCR